MLEAPRVRLRLEPLPLPLRAAVGVLGEQQQVLLDRVELRARIRGRVGARRRQQGGQPFGHVPGRGGAALGGEGVGAGQRIVRPGAGEVARYGRHRRRGPLAGDPVHERGRRGQHHVVLVDVLPVPAHPVQQVGEHRAVVVADHQVHGRVRVAVAERPVPGGDLAQPPGHRVALQEAGRGLVVVEIVQLRPAVQVDQHAGAVRRLPAEDGRHVGVVQVVLVRAAPEHQVVDAAPGQHLRQAPGHARHVAQDRGARADAELVGQDAVGERADPRHLLAVDLLVLQVGVGRAQFDVAGAHRLRQRTHAARVAQLAVCLEEDRRLQGPAEAALDRLQRLVQAVRPAGAHRVQPVGVAVVGVAGVGDEEREAVACRCRGQPPLPARSILAQVSRRPMVRLNTGRSGVASRASRQK